MIDEAAERAAMQRELRAIADAQRPTRDATYGPSLLICGVVAVAAAVVEAIVRGAP